MTPHKVGVIFPACAWSADDCFVGAFVPLISYDLPPVVSPV